MGGGLLGVEKHRVREDWDCKQPTTTAERVKGAGLEPETLGNDPNLFKSRFPNL